MAQPAMAAFVHRTDPVQRKLCGILVSGPAAPGRTRQVLVLSATLLVQACASLPDVDREMAKPHSAEVEFESAAGPVSSGRGERILDQLEGAQGASDVLAKHLAYEQAVNVGSPLVLGNKLTLLQDGPETYAAMFADIRNARDHINLETYIFDDDVAGGQFADLLLERQAAGVQVNIIHDSFGSITTPAAFFDRLRAGGVRVLEFNPINPLLGKQKSWRINHRDHRKQLIVDGRIAFTGGINISDTYSSGPSGGGARTTGATMPDAASGWRDTHIRIEGPVVAEFQKLFLQTWSRQRAEAVPTRQYFPVLHAQGDEIVRAIGSTPDEANSQIYLTLVSAISHAESTVHLTIAYFAPDRQLLKALTDAAARGVDVRLVLPSHTDSGLAFHLGRSYYAKLLRAGVKLYERGGGLMHAKTVSIDGVWSTVGSTNLDWRSFLHNDEINAVILGRDFAAQMDAMFAADVAESQVIDARQWRHRSVLMRLKERIARIGAYWL